MAGWLTRGQVARRLGLAVASVRRFEGNKLHPVQNGTGVWMFDPGEVAALAAERSETRREEDDSPVVTEGDLAAHVFGLLERGLAFSAVIRETRQPPATIRRLFREWRAGFGEIVRDDADKNSEAELEAQRTRDDREMRVWEDGMRKLQATDDQEAEVEDQVDDEDGVPIAVRRPRRSW